MVKLLPFVTVALFLTTQQDDPYIKDRQDMVRDQLAARGITDRNVLGAMRSVPRHLFVPPNLQSQAYNDNPLPIGYGQTISQPFIVAYMTEIVRPHPQAKVLEIGSGSGYQAAVLAEIVDKVFTVEIIPELGAEVMKKFTGQGYDNIIYKVDDGYNGWEEYAPFDAIVVTAAAESIPAPLMNQLKIGGRMIIPVGSPLTVQSLILVEKSKSKTTTKNLMPVRFVPFTRKE